MATAKVEVKITDAPAFREFVERVHNLDMLVKGAERREARMGA